MKIKISEQRSIQDREKDAIYGYFQNHKDVNNGKVFYDIDER